MWVFRVHSENKESSHKPKNNQTRLHLSSNYTPIKCIFSPHGDQVIWLSGMSYSLWREHELWRKYHKQRFAFLQQSKVSLIPRWIGWIVDGDKQFVWSFSCMTKFPKSCVLLYVLKKSYIHFNVKENKLHILPDHLLQVNALKTLEDIKALFRLV